MVITLFLFLVLNAFENNHSLKMSCIPNTLYRGQKTVCDFILYSKNLNRIRVEVIKFPQFRGFWSKNLMLRQGDLELLRDENGMVKIGTYSLIPMMEGNNFVITGLKLAIKDSLKTRDDFVEIENEPIKLTIKNLPKPPPDVQVNLVGKYNFRSLNEFLYFNPNQPINIKYLIEGDGNLAEITKLDFPKDIPYLKVLSSRTFQYGDNSKIFEYICHVSNDTVIPPIFLDFFNPENGKYQRISSKEVKLLKKAAVFEKPEKRINSKLIFKNYKPIKKSFIFGLIGLALLLFFIYKFRKFFKLSSKPKKEIKIIWKKIKKAFNKKDKFLFLKYAKELLLLIEVKNKNFFKSNDYFNKMYKEISSSHDKFFYSAEKEAHFDFEKTYNSLEIMIKKFKAGLL